MTAEELIEDINSCYGPCGKLCLSCPEAHYLREIKQVVEDLMLERDRYRTLCERMCSESQWRELCEKYHETGKF